VQYRVASEDDDSAAMSPMIQQFYDCLIQSIDAVKAWADRVPGFSELCKHDQEQLFQTAALELVMLRIAYTCRSVSFLYVLSPLFLLLLVVLLGRDADLHMAQLIPLTLTVSCFRKSRLVLV